MYIMDEITKKNIARAKITNFQARLLKFNDNSQYEELRKLLINLKKKLIDDDISILEHDILEFHRENLELFL